MQIDPVDAVGPLLSAAVADGKLEVDMRAASAIEYQGFLSNLREMLATDLHVRAGQHRLKDWANGWAENLSAFQSSSDTESLIPRYFGKYPEVRLNGHLYFDAGKKAELKLLRILELAAVKWTRNAIPFDEICEFGAGTGHNLLALSEHLQLKALRGYEWSWSGVGCINEIGKKVDSRISGQFFDYFAPGLHVDNDLADCAVITVASLEQIGSGFRPFLEFLRRARPAVVINIEPIQELMGDDQLAQLSMDYAKKRNYLDGYYDYLKNLQQVGGIEVLLEEKSRIGSKFLNGYGTMIWRWLPDSKQDR